MVKKGNKFSKRVPKWFTEIDPETDEPIENKKWKKWKKSEPIKPILSRSIIKELPAVYNIMDYTPQELWKKFNDYLARSDKNYEEITISWFQLYASVWRNYLNKKEKSQEYEGVVDAIYQTFEYRYEQWAAKWNSVAYIMNNRFKGKRESSQTNNNNLTWVSKDVVEILDNILNKGNGGETKV